MAIKKKKVVKESSKYKMTKKPSTRKVNKLTEEFSKKFNEDKKSDYPHSILVRFRNKKDIDILCNLMRRDIDFSDKEIIYKKSRRKDTGLYKVTGKRKQKKEKAKNLEWKEHWVGMPSFVQNENKWEYHKLKVIFENSTNYRHFANLVRQYLSLKTKSIYYPEWTQYKLKDKKWVSSLPKSKKNPKYPVFIVSLGRAHSRYTAKALEEINVPYYIVVEPKEYDDYCAVIDRKKVLQLPYNSDPNNLTGPGRARNWCWDYALNELKAKRFWVLDDNITAFYRLHRNRRLKVADGAIFRAAEDFVDRYENIPLAGFQYRFFVSPKSYYPAYVANTRIYSCSLIDTSCRHRFRERYNEDTILSLDILSDGDCTVQFNSFLQAKEGTQKLKGGNTEVFYHAEGQHGLEKGDYNPVGTVAKSLNLLEIYPEYTKIVKRYGRVHHYVDYKPFKSNQLVKRKGLRNKSKANEYGMNLVNMETGEIELLKKQQKQEKSKK